MFVTVYQYLSYLAGIAVTLQKQVLDILEVYHEIAEISRVYKIEQINIDSDFVKNFDHACRIAGKVGSAVLVILDCFKIMASL